MPNDALVAKPTVKPAIVRSKYDTYLLRYYIIALVISAIHLLALCYATYYGHCVILQAELFVRDLKKLPQMFGELKEVGLSAALTRACIVAYEAWFWR